MYDHHIHNLYIKERAKHLNSIHYTTRMRVDINSTPLAAWHHAVCIKCTKYFAFKACQHCSLHVSLCCKQCVPVLVCGISALLIACVFA